MNGPLGDLAGWAAGRFKLQESPLPHRFALIGVCVLYLTLAVWYTQSAPVLEIGDEIWHYQVADHLAAGRGLLVQGTTPGAGIGHQEASQPPLYYLGAAATIRLLDPDPEQPRFLWNPWSYAGWQGAGATPFLLLHTTAERFPGEGYARIAHLLRLQSVLFGLGTVLGVYAIGRLTAPKRPALALLMAALVAFNPGFLLVSSVVGNDSLAICLTTLAALALFGPAARTGRWPAYAAFGVLAALAGLTKVSALTILLPAALLILYQSRRVVCLLAVGLPVLLINGWWFVRNLMLYGELTGTRRMALIAGLRDQPLSVEQWVREVASVWASYWGIRAEALPVWARVALPVAMLALLGLGAYVALRRPAAADLGGAGSFGWGDRQRWVELALHAVWAASLFGLLLVWTAQTPASYGRLLYPGIAAFTLLLVVGLARLLPPALFRGLALAVPLGLLVWAGLFPSRVLAHEFRDLRWPAPAQAVDRPLETPAGALPSAGSPASATAIGSCWTRYA